MKRWLLTCGSLVLGGAIGTFAAVPMFHAGTTTAAQPTAPTGLSRETGSYRDIVKHVLPAVVSIKSKAKPVARKTTTDQPRRRFSFDDQRIPEEFRKFFEDMPQAPFEGGGDEQNPVLGFGSGFIIDPQGVVMTNYHVVDGADQVEVALADGRKFLSKDIKVDPKTDLAIVRLETKESLPYLEFGDSSQMEIGDRVLAVGAPFGLEGTVTAGIVSSKGRNLGMNFYEDFLQTDAAINPGNSGGPLLSLDGKVIGVNSAIKTRTGGFQGIGMAISSNLAKDVAHQLEQNGAVRRGYLGLQMKDLNDRDLAERLGVHSKGVLVTQVFPDTPAAKAGIKEGDVIVSLAGKPVKEGHELQGVVARLPLHKPVEVGIIRDGKPTKLEVTIQEQPQDYGNERVPVRRIQPKNSPTVNLDKIGAELSDLTPDLAEQLGFKDNAKGAVITRVDRDGVAAEAGLTRGMLITQVNRHAVASASEAQEQMDKANLDKGILLQVKSPRTGTSFVLLRKAATASK
jgi:serine protease Do